MIADIFENFLVMVLTVVALLGGFYLLLLVLNAWLKFKTGSREQEGLSTLWASTMKEAQKGDGAAGDPADRKSPDQDRPL